MDVKGSKREGNERPHVCMLHTKTHNKHKNEVESNIQKWLSAVREWKPILDHGGTLVAEGNQLPSFTSSAIPSVFMCYVSTQRRPISFPLQDWFMASISMFMRCHRAKKKSPAFFRRYSARTGVAMQHRGTDTERGDGVTLSSRWDSLLAFSKVAVSDENCVSALLNVYLCLQNPLGVRETELCAESLL